MISVWISFEITAISLWIPVGITMIAPAMPLCKTERLGTTHTHDVTKHMQSIWHGMAKLGFIKNPQMSKKLAFLMTKLSFKWHGQLANNK